MMGPRSSYSTLVSTSRRVSMGILAIWLILAIMGLLLGLCALPPPKGTPLLNGPPQFIMLAISVAFAAYLRQVSIHAAELRDKIRHGDVWNYPETESWAKNKMDELDLTSATISAITPFMFGFILLVSARVITDGVMRFHVLPGSHPKWLYVADVLLAIWLFLIFLGLTIAHFKARRADALIRLAARDKEDEIISRERQRGT